jgi:hypothetical protein
MSRLSLLEGVKASSLDGELLMEEASSPIAPRLSAALLKQTWEKIELMSSIHYANLRSYLTQVIALLGHKKAPNESGAFSYQRFVTGILIFR